MEKTLEIDERVRELTEDEMAHVSGGSAGGNGHSEISAHSFGIEQVL